jgi:quinol monooxygenase YgiN
MLILVVRLQVKEECVEAFKAASLSNARESRTEPGIISFDVLEDTDDPCGFALYEVYTQQSARDDHRNTEYYKEWKEATSDMLSQPVVRHLYTFAEKS